MYTDVNVWSILQLKDLLYYFSYSFYDLEIVHNFKEQ